MNRRKKYLALGLLSRMEAIPFQRRTLYRYHPPGAKPITLGYDLADAKRKALELSLNDVGGRTITYWFGEYFASREFRELAARTQLDYREQWLRLRGVFGHMRLLDLQRSHVVKYRDLRGQKASTRANREISLLSSVCSFAMERDDAISENPCKFVRRIKERKRRRNVTPQERKAFLALAEELGPTLHKIGLMGEFAYLTGQRRAGFLRLTMSALKPEGIEFKATKVRANEDPMTVVIAWSDALRACVVAAKASPKPIERLRDPLLFCNLRGEAYTEAGFKALWNKLQQEWAKRGNERFHFHDLLAAHVGAKKERGEPVKDTRGHTTEATGDRIYDRRRIRKGTPAE